MSKKNYENLVNNVVDMVGGKNNISQFAHCVTRLRFTVKDKGLVNDSEIRKLDGVIGAQFAGEQYQIVIGADVDRVYEEVCRKYGFEFVETINENLDKKANFSFKGIIESVTGCLIPLIPAIIAVGMIRVILSVCNQFNLIDTASNTYMVLDFVADSGFYFLPVFAGGYAAKQFNCNTAIGMLIGAMLIHPTFVGLYGTGTALSVFGLPITIGSYSSSVFPSIIGVYVYSLIEKIITKYCPKTVRAIFVPTLSVLIMIPLMFCLIAPAGTILGTYLTSALTAIYNFAGPLGMGLISGLMPLVVFTGMHYPLVFGGLDIYFATGVDLFLISTTIISNFNQAIAGLAVALKNKNPDDKASALACAMPALTAGITEPVMYGVTFKYKTPLIASMIGSFAGAFIVGIGGSVSHLFAGTSLFALAGFIDENPMNLIWMLIGLGVGGVVTFVLTMIIYKPQTEE